MTTDKPKWWQSWMVYTLVGLLLTLGPYVGGYFLLGVHGGYVGESTVVMGDVEGHYREFKYVGLRKMFAPLGWAEAKIRGKYIDLQSPGGLDHYEPGW